MLVKNSFKRSRDEVERATAVLLASVNGENEVRVVKATGVGVSDIVVSELMGSLCSTLPSDYGRPPPPKPFDAAALSRSSLGNVKFCLCSYHLARGDYSGRGGSDLGAQKGKLQCYCTFRNVPTHKSSLSPQRI